MSLFRYDGEVLEEYQKSTADYCITETPTVSTQVIYYVCTSVCINVYDSYSAVFIWSRLGKLCEARVGLGLPKESHSSAHHPIHPLANTNSICNCFFTFTFVHLYTTYCRYT